MNNRRKTTLNAQTVYLLLCECGIWGLLVLFGKGLSRLLPLHNPSKTFLFFPFYHVGGAERVHADIATCFAAEKPWLIFTRRSSNRGYFNLFPEMSKKFILWPLGYLFPISLGLAAGLINRHHGAFVFGANSPFYYRLIPYLAHHVRKSDLTHAFDGLEELSLTTAPLLDARVVISKQTSLDLERQYRDNGLDPELVKRIILVPNKVKVPLVPPEKVNNGSLRVLFVGRGTHEKRAHLIGRIASTCQRNGVNAVFTLVGDMGDTIAAEDRHACTLTGMITDPVELNNLYGDAHILLLVSSREGFPLVIMEAMAQGVVPITTNVGGIGDHIRNGWNGLLINESDEDSIVSAACRGIKSLCDRSRRESLAQTAHRYALEQFNNPDFCQNYYTILRGEHPISTRPKR